MSISEKFAQKVNYEEISGCVAELAVMHNLKQMNKHYEELSQLKETLRGLYPQVDGNRAVYEEFFACLRKMNTNCDLFLEKIEENEILINKNFEQISPENYGKNAFLHTEFAPKIIETKAAIQRVFNS